MILRLRLGLVSLCCFLGLAGHTSNTATNVGKLILDKHTPIYTSATPGSPLYKAVLALQRDMKKVLGGAHPILPLTAIQSTGVVVLNGEKDSLDKSGAKKISGWEVHRVYTTLIGHHAQLLAAGADMRGTIYALYTVSEKILGVPPLWYFGGWNPDKRSAVKVQAGLNIYVGPPAVKFRAWFPNDMDLFNLWRKKSPENDQLWLETALRLKLNTIEWNDQERDYGKPYSVSRTTRLISDYGLINTSHHHSPLNASFAGWKDYWEQVRDTVAPELLLSNEKYLEEFWRYNVKCITRNHIDMLWVIGFRGNGDHPFWYTFKDAPRTMQERGAVIDHMLEKQRQIVLAVTGKAKTSFRTIYYDELSDLLAKGYLHPPSDTAFIRTYVAARRDHYPNMDIRELKNGQDLRLGYYFNYQFTSTGSHLAACEGPWKMEQNYRYVAGKSDRPLAYTVVNAGNIREFVMELSANAAMMWNFAHYSTDFFLQKFCGQYYGEKAAGQAAQLYRDYYRAFWNQRKPELKGFDRQFVFQDLRYKRAIQEIARNFGQSRNLNPLTDIPAEQVKGRTYRIVSRDNGATNQLDAIIYGTTRSAKQFKAVAAGAEVLFPMVKPQGSLLFSDNLRQPAY